MAPNWQDRYKQLYPGQISSIQGFQQGTINPFIQGTTPGEQAINAGTSSQYNPFVDDYSKQIQLNAMGNAQGVFDRTPEGFTPEQQQAITQGAKTAAYSPIAASASAAGDQLRRNAAVTGSPTALAGNLAGLSRQRGQDLSTTGAQLSTTLPQMFHSAQMSDLGQKAQEAMLPGQLALGAQGAEQAGYRNLGLGPQLAMQRFGTGTGAWNNAMQGIIGMGGQLAGLAGGAQNKTSWGDVGKTLVSKSGVSFGV